MDSTVDVICDGAQVHSGPVTSYSTAYDEYDRILTDVIRDEHIRNNNEYSVRLIRNGDVIATACVVNGEVLDSFDHR